MHTVTLTPIGEIRSPYKEKFAIPRQPGLVNACGELHLYPPYNQSEAVRGLEAFSHIWVIFVFHQIKTDHWHATIRPPRLGGNTRVGVFASRSPFRPNPVGLSLLELTGIQCQNQQVILQVNGLDLLDGTPVLDIKPYLPYAEALTQAHAGYAQQAPAASMPVFFTREAQQQLVAHASRYPDLSQLLTDILAQDPRPAYQRNGTAGRSYAAKILEFTVRWRVTEQGTEVFALEVL